MPRKQRHTGTGIYEILSTHKNYKDKLLVGQQTVINYVTKKKRELSKSVYDTAILGCHAPYAAQVDFGDVYAFNAVGTMTKYHELVISFPSSNGGYTQLCKSENAECLLEAMQRVFDICAKFREEYYSITCRGRYKDPPKAREQTRRHFFKIHASP